MDSELLGGMIIFFVIFYVVMILFSLAMAVLQIIAQWKLFEKAGEKGWTSIIPIYNYLQMIKIATGKYTLGWIYLGICVLYIVITFVAAIMGVFFEQNGYDTILNFPLMLIPYSLLIPMYALAGYVNFMFGKAYGKSTAWNVCMIFFAPILIIIMGFDKKTVYVGTNGIPQNYT
ncbi:MAG: hypothetical protein K2O36_04595 [Ruminococcus sp.]|nr:hypothetical protein [Ruminococcus sp.]